MSYNKKLKLLSLIGAIFSFCLLVPDLLWAEPGLYLQSAHGSNSYGVARPAMMTDDAQTVDAPNGYARGNCAHCHEMHASIAGSEPLHGGGPSPYTLFAPNFNSAFVPLIPGNYEVTHNFCFYCHGEGLDVVQAVVNGDYSTTFGGGSDGTLPQSIRGAFNQTSYHNLGDIHILMTTGDGAAMAPWYTSSSNPCNACHNPHLAKRNYEDFTPPLSSAISRPKYHFSLWGDSEDNTETMAQYSWYEAPIADTSSGKREPDGTSPTADSSKTPDYVTFCTDCHNTSTDIYSTTKGDYLIQVNWGVGGEKHGVVARDVASGATTDTSLDARNPYEAVDGTKDNFVLSCLDCHEPHGSPNIMLLRRRVNGEAVNVTTLGSMANLCARCHSSNWEYIHHLSDDHPYVPVNCKDCHLDYVSGSGGGGPPPIPCSNCHMHGMTDPKGTGRKTF